MGGEQRRAVLHDVAREAGVSTALVSFALNDRAGVAPATKQRILEAAEKLNYRANPHARSLRTGQSGTVGLLVRNLSNPYFIDVIRGAQEAAHDVGMSVLVVDADYSAEREREHIERLATQSVDGLAISPVGSAHSIERWLELRPDAPLVLLGATAPITQGMVHVAADRRRAVELATAHLAELGHRRVAFFTPSSDAIFDHERLDAFLDLAPNYDIEPVPVEIRITASSVEEATTALLRGSDPPTALIANSDFAAYAVYDAARRLGLRIGEDISVIGHDDVRPSHLLDPPLTTVKVDLRQIGRAVFERVVPGGETSDYVEPVELVVRQSSSPNSLPRRSASRETSTTTGR